MAEFEIYDRAWGAYQIARYDLAESIVVDGLAQFPESFALLTLLGYVKIGQDKFQAARAIGADVVTKWPEESQGYDLQLRATIWDPIRMRDDGLALERARELANRVLELAPDDSDSFIMLSEVYYFSNEPQESLEAAKKGLELAPDNEKLLDNFGRACLELGRDDEAVGAYSTCLTLNPEDARAHFKLARIHLTSRRFDLAAQHARSAVQLRPDAEDCRNLYWETVKSRIRFLRPLVYLKLTFNWITAGPEWRFYITIIGVNFFCIMMALLAKFLWPDSGTWNEPVVSGIVCFIPLLLLVAYDRPLMVVSDLVLAARDPVYRTVVDNRRLVAEGLGFLVICVLAVAAIPMLFGVNWLAISFCLGCFFLIPIFQMIFAERAIQRVALCFSMILMACFLVCTVWMFQNSEPNSFLRNCCIYSFIVYVMLGIGSKVLAERF